MPEIDNFRSKEIALELINTVGFGQLVTVGSENQVNVSSLAFEARKTEEGGALYSHIPRAFHQHKDIERAKNVTALFTGAHGYISPTWYKEYSAPTWDFETVRVDGRPEVLPEDGLLEHLDRLINLNEDDGSPFSLDILDNSYLERLLPQIVGFKIPLENVHVRQKLSQDKNPEETEVIYRGLEIRNKPLDSWLGKLILRAEELETPFKT